MGDVCVRSVAFEIGSIGLVALIAALLGSPFMLLVFRPRVQPGGLPRNILRMARNYWVHAGLFLFIWALKNYVDTLNDPVRGVLGDFTFLIHRLEGDLVLAVQSAFQHPVLTALLNANYLFAYVFITYFGFVLAAYMDDRELANKMALNVVVVYLLSIPFYVFFNVQITSDYIPQMRALLYHGSEAYLTFFTANDPMDNAWPSLHIGIPFGFLLLFVWTERKRHAPGERWTYHRYINFLIVEILLFTFSILYLGIHWILDIPGGLLIGLLGATLVEELHDPWFRLLYGIRDRVMAAGRAATSPVTSRFRGGLGRPRSDDGGTDDGPGTDADRP